MTDLTPTLGDREPPVTRRGKDAGIDFGLRLDGAPWRTTARRIESGGVRVVGQLEIWRP